LPVSTFLFEAKAANDRDVLMAYDVESGALSTVTDLRGDGSEGWSIDGYSISHDRMRIAVASLYGATQADVDTKLPTQHIWTFATDGSDFRRLTPVFPNTGGGRKQFQIEIRNPSFSLSGADVLYNYGEYWYEGTTLQGGSAIWSVGAGGGTLPSLLPTTATCSLVDPSVDPKTGKIAIIHSVCAGSKDGIYLYAADGSGAPEALVTSDGPVNVSLEPPRWIGDGTGFLFIGTTTIMVNGSNAVARGLFAFDMQTRKSSPLVVPQDPDARVVDASVAPDGRGIVYCLQQGEAQNLHLIDLTKDSATDAAITNDGKSCHAVW
jgi:Tol biopolymer transport system component